MTPRHAVTSRERTVMGLNYKINLLHGCFATNHRSLYAAQTCSLSSMGTVLLKIKLFGYILYNIFVA